MIVLYLMVARIATNLVIITVVVLGMVIMSHKLNKRSENCLDVKENLKTEKSAAGKQPVEDLWILPHSWNRSI